MAVSLKDVAARAGVSPKTVSNVVNERPHVTPETRDRVQAAMAELGYRPNLQARSLRAGRTDLLMLAIPDLTAPYFAELAHLVISAAADHGYTVLIEETEGLHERELRALRGARALLVDGVIISPLALTAVDLHDIDGRTPLVLLGERNTGLIADHVAIDNVAAARDATMHLLRRGRRRIAVVGYQEDPSAGTAQLRMRGVAEALAGVPDAALVEPLAPLSGYTWTDGAAAVDVYLRRTPLPDALVCFNDELAIAAIRRLHELGCRVPGELAVIGIDGIKEAEFVTPSLSTIAPDKTALAASALASLTRRISRAEVSTPDDVVIPHRLVVRESTA